MRVEIQDTTTPREAFARDYFRTLAKVLERLPFAEIARAMGVLERALVERRRVFIAGNGGSASTAGHMANDLVEGVSRAGGRPLRAISLADPTAALTCIGNDHGYADVFARQLRAHADAGDVLIAISGSGDSENILRVIEAARELGVTTIGLLGREGGKARALVEISVVVPIADYGPIEDVHLSLNHVLTAWLRDWQAGKVRQ